MIRHQYHELTIGEELNRTKTHRRGNQIKFLYELNSRSLKVVSHPVGRGMYCIIIFQELPLRGFSQLLPFMPYDHKNFIGETIGFFCVGAPG